jgi:hypothetical protein
MRKTPLYGFAVLVACVAALPGAGGCGRSTAASVPQATAASTGSSEAGPALRPAEIEPAKHATPLPSTSEPPAASLPNEPASDVASQPVSAPATPPKPLPPPADRAPTRPGDAEKLTFDDLNLGMQADIVFRPFMLTDRVNELAGKRVSIIGYMHGGVQSQRGIKEFILLKNTQCKFGPGGQADHLASVTLKDGQTTSLTTSPLKVEGTLRIEPFQGPDGNTWSIFRLEDSLVR